MAIVGYYDLRGAGRAAQVNEIREAGHQPVRVTELTPDALRDLDALYVHNESNFGFRPSYKDALPDLTAAVEAGLDLLFFDRFVDLAAANVPGAGEIEFLRRTSGPESKAVNIGPEAPEVFAPGVGYPLTDDSFDGGNSSSHGFAMAETLPDAAVVLLTRSAPEEAVAFTYGFGAGSVLYSTIPLDFYSTGRSQAITPTEVASLVASSLAVLGHLPEGRVVRGTTGPDERLGGYGDDTLVGLADNDILIGSLGDDLLRLGAGDDSGRGGAGDDTLLGSAGKDLLIGGAGADLLDGGVGQKDAARYYSADGLVIDLADPSASTGDAAGDMLLNIERVYGGGADDTLIADADGGWLVGARGNDVVTGGDGRDLLKGWAGEDTLEGGAGNDRLVGGPGTDLLTGGDGADVFVLHEGDGLETVTDLEAGDRIQVSRDLLTEDENSGGEIVAAYGMRDGEDAVLRFDAATGLILKGYFADPLASLEAFGAQVEAF